MSEDQLAALLAELNDNADLREKLQCAPDLDAVVTIAQSAGFEISKAEWLKYESRESSELSDNQLEAIAGGENRSTETAEYCNTIGHGNLKPCTLDWEYQCKSKG